MDALVRCTALNEDPFANAYIENLRMEANSNEKKLKQVKFKADLKKRLNAYKKVKSQINEDCQIKVQETNKLTHFHGAKKVVKFDYIVARLNNIHISEVSKKSARSQQLRANSSSYSSFSESGKSINSLNSLLIEPNEILVRSLRSDLHIIEKQKVEAQKRISLVRKTYGILERQNASKLKQLQEESEQKSTALLSCFPQRTQEKSTENDETIEELFEGTCEGRGYSPTNFFKKNKKRVSQQVKVKKSSQETDSESKKSPSLNRCIHYLKQMIKEKSEQQNADIPTLCQCNSLATLIWKTDWNTCANNCVFYNNPKGNKIILVHLSIE